MKRTLAFRSLFLVLLVTIYIAGCCKEKTCDPCDAGSCNCPRRTAPDARAPAGADDIGEICAHDSDCAQHCIVGLSGMAPYCTRSCQDQACPRGYLCLSQGQAGMVCVVGPCESSEDCPDDYSCYLEDPENPVCRHADIECDGDGDCPANTACNQGLCELLCQSDDDCKQGYHCQWQRRCAQCANDSHCEDGFSCQDGNCNMSCIDRYDCRTGFQCSSNACEKISGGGSIEYGTDDAGCDENADCEDFCYENQYCTRTCETDADCPEGYACHTGYLFCQPQ